MRGQQDSLHQIDTMQWLENEQGELFGPLQCKRPPNTVVDKCLYAVLTGDRCDLANQKCTSDPYTATPGSSPYKKAVQGHERMSASEKCVGGTYAFQCNGWKGITEEQCKLKCDGNEMPAGCSGKKTCIYYLYNAFDKLCRLADTGCKVEPTGSGSSFYRKMGQMGEEGVEVTNSGTFVKEVGRKVYSRKGCESSLKRSTRCNGVNTYDGSCCTASNCGLVQGDCDSDSDCTGSLRCGINNCPRGKKEKKNVFFGNDAMMLL